MTQVSDTSYYPWSYAYTVDGERVAEFKGIFEGGVFSLQEEYYSIRGLDGKVRRTFKRDSSTGQWS